MRSASKRMKCKSGDILFLRHGRAKARRASSR
jgi:hypothetical protein